MPRTLRLCVLLSVVTAVTCCGWSKELHAGNNNGTVTLTNFCWYPGSWHCRLDPEDIAEITLDFEYPDDLSINTTEGLNDYLVASSPRVNSPPGTFRERIVATFPLPQQPPQGSVDLYEVIFQPPMELRDQTSGRFDFRLPDIGPAAFQTAPPPITDLQPVDVLNLMGLPAQAGDIVAAFPILSITDYDGDAVVDNNDVDLLAAAIRAGTHEEMFDIDANGDIDNVDRGYWFVLRGVLSADFDLDGIVTASDDGAILLTNLGVAGSKGHGDGDADGDGRVQASLDGALLLNQLSLPLDSTQVPEPSAILLAVGGLIGIGLLRRRSTRSVR